MKRSKIGPKYSKVTRAIWGDGKFTGLSRSAPCAQMLFLRLLTAPELSPFPGLIPIGRLGLCEALDWDPEDLDRCFAELHAKGMALADWKVRLVWLPKAFAHNPPESPNVIRAWRKALLELPDCELRARAEADMVARSKALGDAWFRAASGKAYWKPSSKPFVEASPNHIRNRNIAGTEAGSETVCSDVTTDEGVRAALAEVERAERERATLAAAAALEAAEIEAAKPKSRAAKATPKPSSPAMSDPDVLRLLDVYRSLHGKDDRWSATTVEEGRTRADRIYDALHSDRGDRFTADEIELAFRANAVDEWCKDKGKHEIVYILRGGNLDRFVKAGKKGPPRPKRGPETPTSHAEFDALVLANGGSVGGSVEVKDAF